ncbi:hypothetical protein OROHE_026675 [Orobanche hederae]
MTMTFCLNSTFLHSPQSTSRLNRPPPLASSRRANRPRLQCAPPPIASSRRLRLHCAPPQLATIGASPLLPLEKIIVMRSENENELSFHYLVPQATEFRETLSLPFWDGYVFYGECGGLLLFSSVDGEITLCNPTTGDFKFFPRPRLPQEDDVYFEPVGFGYDHTSDDYKMVRIFWHDYYDDEERRRIHGVTKGRAHVYSLKCNSWKEISCPENAAFVLSSSTYVGGGSYNVWLGPSGYIMSFDFATEEFKKISPLPTGDIDDGLYQLVDLDGKLGAIIHERPTTGARVEVHVMEEDGSWARIFRAAFDNVDVVRTLGLKHGRLFLEAKSGREEGKSQLLVCHLATSKLEWLEVYDNPETMKIFSYIESTCSLPHGEPMDGTSPFLDSSLDGLLGYGYIVSFDFASEEFKEISLPIPYHFVEVDGTLGAIIRETSTGACEEIHVIEKDGPWARLVRAAFDNVDVVRAVGVKHGLLFLQGKSSWEGKSHYLVCDLATSTNLEWFKVYNESQRIGFDIGFVCEGLPALTTLNLSNNYLSADISNVPQLSNVRILVLNQTGVIWKQVEILKDALPRVDELHLMGNKLSEITPESSTVVTGFNSLRFLNLENNSISAWDEIIKLSQLRSLEQLFLNNNNINHIWYPACGKLDEPCNGSEPHEKSSRPFSSLRGIFLVEIRLSENPVADLGKGGVPRFVFIARLAKIAILNASEVNYVRLVMSKFQGSPEEIRRLHPRFCELKKIHGLDDERPLTGASAPQNMASRLIFGKLKFLCDILFKLKSIKPILYIQEEGSPLPTLLEDDMASLTELGVASESTILVDELS